jgi:hypothetical protein
VNTKLTLRLDADLIGAAKRHAAAGGKSVSQLVEDYFAVLVAVDEPVPAAVTPGVRRLMGILRDASPEAADEEAYRAHLERKHLGGAGR